MKFSIEWRGPALKYLSFKKTASTGSSIIPIKIFLFFSLQAQELSRQQNDFNREVGRLQAENEFLRRNVDPDVLVQWNNNVQQQQQPPQQQPQQPQQQPQQQQNQEQQRQQQQQNTQQPPQPPPQH